METSCMSVVGASVFLDLNKVYHHSFAKQMALCRTVPHERKLEPPLKKLEPPCTA